MVTCQSANQLKTPAKVSWAFKMVSQFGSLGYTIMGKTADLTVVQKTIIDTLHKEGKPQTFIAKEAGCSQSAVSKHVNRELSGRKKMHKRPKNADELKATVKETWASIPPQQCHKLINSMPRRIEAVIKTKGAPTKYWVHIQ